MLILCITKIHAQSVSINTDGSPADSSALLDLSSTSGGLLIPRMTLAQRDMINAPATGLVIYQTGDEEGFYFYTGVSWSNLVQRENAWCVGGNSGTDPDAHFIGTTDSMPLRFRVNNTWAGGIGGMEENSYLGINAGYSNTIGNSNTGFGSYALYSNTTGYNNTANGREALYANTNGISNTAVGTESLFSNTNGNYNTALGKGALWSNLSGNYNSAIGSDALLANTTGGSNTATGAVALISNTTGYWNTATGTASMFTNTTGYYNTATGTNALYYNTSGHRNTANGNDALFENTTGYRNTAIGYASLLRNSTGYENTAIGGSSLYWNTSGSANTATGNYALFSNTTGIFNTAIGAWAMYLNITGNQNTAVGRNSLYANTIGTNNTAFGGDALQINNDGGANCAIGAFALNQNVSGDYNVALGTYSGTDASYDNTISIGNNGYYNAWHNQAFIGNLSTGWIGGNVTWSTYSDARVKTNVTEDVKGLDFITRLRPVTYYRDIRTQAALTGNTETEDFEGKYDIEQIKFSGFLAQEVEEAAIASSYAFSGLTAPRNEKELYTLSYEAFVVPLVKALQEQQGIIVEQSNKIDMLEQRMAAIELLLQQIKK
jgi:hypothetical protein